MIFDYLDSYYLDLLNEPELVEAKGALEYR
jgi:hypothetical protein